MTNVVARFVPFHLTVELERKLEPLTVRVKAGPPALAALGLILFSTGAGAAVTVKLKILVVVCGVG